MKSFNDVIQKYKNSKKMFLDIMKDNVFSNIEKNVFKKEIEAYDEFIEDLELLKQIYEPYKNSEYYADDKSAVKYDIEDAKNDIWKLREDIHRSMSTVTRDSSILRMIDLLYSLADVVSRKDK
jgi:hypothetical protein